MAGSFLLNTHAKRKNRRDGEAFLRLRPGIAPALAVALVTAALLLRNAPAITLANRQPLSAFGALAVRSLPPGGGVVLCDDPLRLRSFQAALSRSAAHRKWLAVDTTALGSPAYRAGLERQQPGAWLTEASRHELSPVELLQLMDRVARSNRVVYLHPSFGDLLEQDGLQFHWNGGIDRSRCSGLLEAYLVQKRVTILPVEERLECEKFNSPTAEALRTQSQRRGMQ